MRTILKLVSLALTAATLAPANATVLSGPIVNPANGSTYYLLSPGTWLASQAEAVSLGGNLTSINNAAENTWILSTFGSFGGSPRTLWTGLTDSVQEGTFSWVNGDPVTYTNFGLGEPNNFNNEDYVALLGQNFPPLSTGQWNDAANDTLTTYGSLVNGVVEIAAVPEASTAALLTVGLLGLGLGLLVCSRKLQEK